MIFEANRAVDTAYSNTALLQKVVYPTGGYSEIKYEPNVYNVLSSKRQH